MVSYFICAMSTNILNKVSSKVSAKPKQDRVTWLISESRALIGVVQELQVLRKLDDKKSKKKSLYKDIQSHFMSLNPPISKDAINIEHHWKFLRKRYNELKIREEKSGAEAVSWDLYAYMKQLLGDRPLSKAFENGIESQLPEDYVNENEVGDYGIEEFGDISNTTDNHEIDEIREDLGGSQLKPLEKDNPVVHHDIGVKRMSGVIPGEPGKFSAQPVKKPRAEKLMESILQNHEENCSLQQNNLLAALNEQRKSEILEHQKWEAQQRKEQREWEENMIKWQTTQTNDMIKFMSTTLSNAITQIRQNQSGPKSSHEEMNMDNESTTGIKDIN